MTALFAWLAIVRANAVIAGCTYDHKCITNHSASLGLMHTETSALECKILSVNQYYIQTLMNIVNSSWTFSPAETHFDLELRSKVFFFTDSCSADLVFEESK